jgi:16S rRNA (adenine1518-N6/adenine1519-N6)-dimethyltransferase
MLTAAELKPFLRARGLRLSKRLGQNYLIDARIIERIAAAAGLAGRETAVEIGAGLGALTEALAARAGKVIAVEIDRGVCEALRERMRPYANVEVRHQDILEFPWAGHRSLTVIGAIPYHITSPILAALSEQRRRIDRAVLVVQAEVAERLMAGPGTKAYGRLSLLAQHGWVLSPVCKAPRSAFFPQPDVDSMCLKLDPRPAASGPRVEDEPLFFAVVKAAFAQRRKTLVNNLRALPLDAARAGRLVQELGLPETVRAEELSLAQFAALAHRLKANSLR